MQVIDHLRAATFEASLKVWPYRLAGPPMDEVVALHSLHKMRLTAPGLTDRERQASLDFLQARGAYEWVRPFVEAKSAKKGKRK